jgi:ATP-dependent DNA ligase
MSIAAICRRRGGQACRQQAWIKVKRHRTVDCVVIGVTGNAESPRLLLGLQHSDAEVHHFA